MTKKVILVVEDNAAMRDLLRLHLAAVGYEVVLAEDAVVAGRALLGSARPDLMLVDANLPYMGGIEFVATAMADTSLPYIPAILISGSDIDLRADALGVAVLKKPFLTDELLQTIGEHLLSRRPGARGSYRAPLAAGRRPH